MQNETSTIQQDKAIASGQPHYSTMLKQIIINAEKILEKQSKGQRHPDVLKKSCTALFIYTGPLAYEFLHQNMPEALPCLRTIQGAVHSEYKTINEGEFRFDDLVTHIHNYNVPHHIVTIAEDATRVIARVEYDNETDRCIGFVLAIT